ncbi:hypothetical protein [Streptosporangium roseum]|uniref:Uncharacterized protein n=1 Tax=Streptosporangium roseum (strain ATCC 12428 / DSM 43021 / JCM 3005 / KCTC 9067 / NCIMB 10171 / NRRL 2505 / NI 9100) TaxID=479432 RepID=D2AT25_STRRD|nr:hypothetical protein [Streptosporangium roseum]ACZ90502.1 hypothetical protein Sros_7839 [Streptosporangium roseum DSM 43021]
MDVLVTVDGDDDELSRRLLEDLRRTAAHETRLLSRIGTADGQGHPDSIDRARESLLFSFDPADIPAFAHAIVVWLRHRTKFGFSQPEHGMVVSISAGGQELKLSSTETVSISEQARRIGQHLRTGQEGGPEALFEDRKNQILQRYREDRSLRKQELKRYLLRAQQRHELERERAIQEQRQRATEHERESAIQEQWQRTAEHKRERERADLSARMELFRLLAERGHLDSPLTGAAEDMLAAIGKGARAEDSLREALRTQAEAMDATAGVEPQRQACAVHVSETQAGPAVRDALVDLAAAFGWTVEPDSRPIIGSFFQRLTMWTKDVATSATAKEIAEEVRRGIELATIHSQQADNDNRQAEAVAKLVQSLEGTDKAVMLVGSILIMKDDGRLSVRTLTQRQLMFLDRHATSVTDPAAVLQALDECARSHHAEALEPPTIAAFRAIETRPDDDLSATP